MATILTSEQIEALRAVDTPTVCNAIERFGVRGRVEGFLGMDIRSLTPELGTMLGYAVTVTVDSTTPDVPAPPESWRQWIEAMAACAISWSSNVWVSTALRPALCPRTAIRG